jgi:hypothetical protein
MAKVRVITLTALFGVLTLVAAAAAVVALLSFKGQFDIGVPAGGGASVHRAMSRGELTAVIVSAVAAAALGVYGLKKYTS